MSGSWSRSSWWTRSSAAPPSGSPWCCRSTRGGTNVAVLNAIQYELIHNGHVDEEFVGAHTVGFDKLRRTVEQYPPERAAEICGVPADDIRAAARVIGSAQRLVST